MKRILTNEMGSASTPNHFSDSQNDAPEYRLNGAKEFKKRLRQKYSDLHLKEDEYSIPDFKDRDSYDREFEAIEDLIADEIPIKEDIDSEKQAVEIFKESMKNRKKHLAGTPSKKRKIERQGEGRDCGTPCRSTPRSLTGGCQNTIHQIFPQSSPPSIPMERPCDSAAMMAVLP